MKKLLCCILAVVVCIGVFAGCGEKDTKSSSSEASSIQVGEQDFGVSAKTVADALNHNLDSAHPQLESLTHYNTSSDAIMGFETKAEDQLTAYLFSNSTSKNAIGVDLRADESILVYYSEQLILSLGFSDEEKADLMSETSEKSDEMIEKNNLCFRRSENEFAVFSAHHKNTLEKIFGQNERPLEKISSYEVVSEQVIPTYDERRNGTTVNYLAEVKNNGNVPICFDSHSSSIDVEDSEGKLISTSSSVYVRPAVLAPGETGYIDEYILSSTREGGGKKPDDIGKIIPHISVQEHKGYPLPEVELTELSMNVSHLSNGDYQAEILGRATNTMTENLPGVWVIIPLEDATGKFIGLFTSKIEGLGPGETKGFDGTAQIYDKNISENDISMRDTLVCGEGKFFG